MQDNEIKRSKANKKYEEENKHKQRWEHRYDSIKEEIKELNEKNRKLEREVSSIKKYEQYLECVRDSYPDEFQDINEITNRHATLKRANSDLSAEKNELETSLAEIKRARDLYEKKNKDDQLEINIDITVKEKKIDKQCPAVLDSDPTSR